jgi:hypothetical protein
MAPRVRVLPGRRPADPVMAREARRLDQTELERVRKTAENWRTGLAGLLGLIATVSVVKGRDTITDLERWAQVLVGISLLIALVCAALGGYLALRAAYGWPKKIEFNQLRIWRAKRSEQTVSDLSWARNLTIATLVFLVAAIGLTWYAPTDPPAFITATWADQTACGKLIDSNETELSIKIDEDNMRQVPLDDLKSLSVVEECE